MTHGEAAPALRQPLHERCQAEAILPTDAETRRRTPRGSWSRTRCAEWRREELELRDFAGAPMSRENASKLPRLAQDREDVLLLDSKPADEARDGGRPGEAAVVGGEAAGRGEAKGHESSAVGMGRAGR